MNMTLRSLVLTGGLLVASLTTTGAGAGYLSLYAFGDSLSDSGNMYNAVWALSGGTVEVPPPPYYQGRASNGPVAVEFLAAKLGLTAKPVVDSSGGIDPAGTNFAVMGSATGPVTQADGTVFRNYMTFRFSPLLPDLAMQDQIGAFAALHGAANPQALYFLWGGANDAYLALEDPGLDQNDALQMNTVAAATALQAANNLGNQILFLASLGARVAVPSTLNVSGLDEQHWQEWPVPAGWAEKAHRQMVAYQSMGATPTWTCAPYQTEWRPSFGQQIAWGESNAIVFANSVIGARTNRYGDFIDIAALALKSGNAALLRGAYSQIVCRCAAA